MMQLKTFQELYVDELRDLYDAEHQIMKELPKMIQHASHQELKDLFQQHLQQTQNQIQRLEQVFQKLGEDPKGKTCRGLAGIVREGEDTLKQISDPDVRDAALISIAQRVEHYEIAGYGTVRTYAQEMGDQESCNLLQQTLNEEGDTDHKLTRLAERRINIEAMQHRKAA